MENRKSKGKEVIQILWILGVEVSIHTEGLITNLLINKER